jgi:hypothetical protein
VNGLSQTPLPDTTHQSQQALDRSATGIGLSDLIDSKWATGTCHANTFLLQTQTTACKMVS